MQQMFGLRLLWATADRTSGQYRKDLPDYIQAGTADAGGGTF